MASVLILTISMLISGSSIKIGYIPKTTVIVIDSSSAVYQSTGKAIKSPSKIKRSGGTPIVASIQVTLLIPPRKHHYTMLRKDKHLSHKIKKN